MEIELAEGIRNSLDEDDHGAGGAQAIAHRRITLMQSANALAALNAKKLAAKAAVDRMYRNAP